nr:kunitz trypsin inhibitor 2 [Ipomoea batatas]GMC78218.1 kunitz trypsin inhibitor 2 [Ipomoea batatas]
MNSITIMFLSFLVFAAITTSVHCTTDPPNPHKQVRDTDGDLVRVETNYYIIPTKKESGGGLSLRSTTDESCPPGLHKYSGQQRLALSDTPFGVVFQKA